VLAKGSPGTSCRSTFTRDGAGTLFYMRGCATPRTLLHHEALDQGFHIERTYAPYVEDGDSPARRRSRRAI
jgi:hypothetical protein